MSRRLPPDGFDPLSSAASDGYYLVQKSGRRFREWYKLTPGDNVTLTPDAGTHEMVLAAAVTGAGTAEATISDRIGLTLTKQGIVLAKGAGGTWDADLVESPSVMYDPKSGKWAMVYVGYGTTTGAQRAGVGLAYSPDGITWTKQGSAAILPHSGTVGAPDQNGCSGPVLFWDDDNGQYVLYYIGLTATGYESGTKSICYATATSLTGPWTRHGAVITTQAATWRSGAVWHVSIVEREGTWYCFFNANAAGAETIGYATAPALTGPWTVDDTNSPLLSPTGSGWESDHIGDPSVRRIGDMWVMAYYGVDASPLSASDGIAVCPDHDFPLGPWARYSGNPVLAPGAAYDAKYAHKPFVIYKGGVLFHYYTAVAADDTRQIALATEGLPVASTPYSLTVQDENGNVSTAVTQIDFQGAGVTATAGTGEVIVTIPGASTVAGELLMQDGVTAPPVPIETEARDDWLYAD